MYMYIHYTMLCQCYVLYNISLNRTYCKYMNMYVYMYTCMYLLSCWPGRPRPPAPHQNKPKAGIFWKRILFEEKHVMFMYVFIGLNYFLYVLTHLLNMYRSNVYYVCI